MGSDSNSCIRCNSLRRLYLTVFFLFHAALYTGCSHEQPEQQPFFLKVNSYQISENELNRQMKFESEVNASFQISEESKADFMQRLIESQVLLQEAKRLKLDEKEKFRQTIERYWQSTLIRDLLNQKGSEIRAKTVVSIEEIQEYYTKNKEALPEKPYDAQIAEIRKVLENDKVTKEMQTWLELLKKTAKVQIKQ